MPLLWLAAPHATSLAWAQAVRHVAVVPCATGPRVPAELGDAFTALLVAASPRVPGTEVLDRSVTRDLLREQDLTLLGNLEAAAGERFAGGGAELIVISSILRASNGFFVQLRCVEIASGVSRWTALQSFRQGSEIVPGAEGWVSEFWRAVLDPPPATVDPSIDRDVQQMWAEVDTAEARRLIGRQWDRTESVYRRYRKAVETSHPDAGRLAAVAANYVAECLSLLQRIGDPPEGMVYVPPGRVAIGIAGQAVRRYEVDGFFIDRCEFTRGQYARFLKETDRPPPLGWTVPADENAARFPVVGVDWFEAAAAAEWRGLRLPTHAQWLRAVSEDGRREYPWGQSWRAGLCVCAQPPSAPALMPVGSCPEGASFCGVLDAAGNVWEWLDSWKSAEYWKSAPALNPAGPDRGSGKLVAGGSFRTGPSACRCDSLEGMTPQTRKDDLGFRCVLPVRVSRGDG